MGADREIIGFSTTSNFYLAFARFESLQKFNNCAISQFLLISDPYDAQRDSLGIIWSRLRSFFTLVFGAVSLWVGFSATFLE